MFDKYAVTEAGSEEDNSFNEVLHRRTRGQKTSTDDCDLSAADMVWPAIPRFRCVLRFLELQTRGAVTSKEIG
jgi:hypothetical protein